MGGFVAMGFAATSLAPPSFVLEGLTAMAFGTGLLGFTGTLDAAGLGTGFVGGRCGLFVAAALGAAFLCGALAGFLTALLGFFEGIYVSASKRKSARLYRRGKVCTG
jgi:hypothetical protein